MRLLILYDREGFAYHRRAEALKKYAPPDFKVTLTTVGNDARRELYKAADVIFLLDYAYSVKIREDMREDGADGPLVVSFNAGPLRRRGMWERVYGSADFVVCNSVATYEAWSDWPRRCAISNGVDLDTFKVVRPVADRPDKCLWYGRASKHWKGYQEVLVPLSNLLTEHDFRFDFRELGVGDPPMDTPAMVDWYNGGAYVLCASQPGYEGTPNLITEAVACGCVAVTTRTGNVLEWGEDRVNCVLVEPNALSVLDGLFHARAFRTELAEAGCQAMAEWGWDRRSRPFFYLFRRLLEVGPDAIEPFSYAEEGSWNED